MYTAHFSSCASPINKIFFALHKLTSFGWKGMFYAFGVGCCLWIPVWFWYAKDSPDKMARINPKELAYLKATVNPAENSEKKTPWANIFLSLPFWVSQTQLKLIPYDMLHMICHIYTLGVPSILNDRNILITF